LKLRRSTRRRPSNASRNKAGNRGLLDQQNWLQIFILRSCFRASSWLPRAMVHGRQGNRETSMRRPNLLPRGLNPLLPLRTASPEVLLFGPTSCPSFLPTNPHHPPSFDPPTALPPRSFSLRQQQTQRCPQRSSPRSRVLTSSIPMLISLSESDEDKGGEVF